MSGYFKSKQVQDRKRIAVWLRNSNSLSLNLKLFEYISYDTSDVCKCGWYDDNNWRQSVINFN